MFEDILDGFKDLEDELEKSKQPDYGEPDPGNVMSLDPADEEWDAGGDWDTGKSWEAEEHISQDDKIWRA